MGTRLEFDKQHHVDAEEDLGAVESALRTAPPGLFGTVQLTSGGQRVLVNAALVRVVKPTPGYETAAFDQA